MRKLEEQYPYSFTFIQKLVKSFEFEDNLNKNYPQKMVIILLRFVKNKYYYR